MAGKPAADLADVFAGLEITPSDEPMPAITRQSTAGPNPFTQPLLASIEHSQPYDIYLPVDAVQRGVFLLNAAAKRENKGVRIWVNCVRDEKGTLVKVDGKVQYQPETKGPHKGQVHIRFQGKAERKQQTAPRPYSLIKDKDNPDVTHVRRRADKVIVFTGTHDEAKAHIAQLKSQETSAA